MLLYFYIHNPHNTNNYESAPVETRYCVVLLLQKYKLVLTSCWIFLYELYYDSRIHVRQVSLVRFTLLELLCRLR
jgi:hypothetical protein